MKKVVFFMLIMFLFITNVSAASKCDYKEEVEINQKSANIKTNYEILEREMPTEEGDIADSIKYDVFNIQILNVTEDFYITVKNDQDKDVKRFDHTNAKDGIISFEWDKNKVVTNFTIEVYTTTETGCPNEKVRTIYLATPRFNPYSVVVACQDLNEFSLCDRYVTFAEIDDDTFYNQLEKYLEKNEKKQDEQKAGDSFIDKTVKFISNNRWYIVGGLIVIAGGAFVVYRITHKKQRELGL